jgi:hypothetical protein
MTAPVADDTDEGMQDAVSHALVRRDPMVLSSPSEIAAIIAERDEDQILRTMAGEVVTEFYYEFEIDGKPIVGISATGAEEFARIRADAGFPIRFPPGSITMDEVTQNDVRGIRVIAVARDCRSGGDGIGMVFEPWMVERKVRERGKVVGVKMVKNDMADRKAFSKARRNAILSLLPEQQILVLLRERKKLIAVNEREQRGALSAASPARATPALARSDDPYAEAPARRAVPKPQQEMVTEEQTARLLDLVSDVNVPERVRDKVEKGIEDGVSAKIAATWITSMEVHANPRAAAGAGDSADDLFGGAGPERKPVSAQSQGH